MNSSGRNEYKLVKGFFKDNWLNYVFGVLALIVVDVLQLLIPGVISNIVDSLNENLATPGFVGEAVLKIVLLAIGMFLFRFVWRLFIVRSARKFEYETLNTLFSKVVSLTPGFFDRMKSGDIMARFTNDLRSVRMMMGPAVVVSVDAVFMTGLTVYFMGTKVNWKLTVIALIPLLLLIPLARYFGTHIHKRFERVQSSFSALSGFTEEAVSGTRIVKSFSVFENMDKLFSEKAKRNLIENIKVVRIWGIFGPMVQLVASSAFLLSLFIGGRMVIKGSITLGEFIAFNTYIGMLIWPMMAYGWLMNIVQRGKASLKRLGLILNAIPEVEEPKKPVHVKKVEEIVIEDLTYSYLQSEREVLKGINMIFRKGEMVGIVGTVGSGKSTVAKLIAKLYPVERRKIFINGVDINDIPSKDVRDRIAYVPQDPFLFSDTIKNNLMLGGNEKEDKEIIEALKLSAVWEDVQKFPKGLETEVGERGVTLSGGQKQRVTIARALLRDADVFIFDDCLSSVDPETEEKIIRTIRDKLKDKLLIVITHRLKVLVRANRIYVLDNGRLVESGSHEELMRNNGLYKRMFERQMILEEIGGGSS